MRLPCGCCEGIAVATPASEINRAGLTAVAYRVGTYASFFETMLARIGTETVDVLAGDGASPPNRIFPLRSLTTRDLSDPAIALLDAWAIVADVLTFYQERIANEGFLPTAVERLSVVELARLVGYEARPGVASSVYLAFTVATGFDGVVPAGTRAQSVPGVGQTPQFFETSEDLQCRDAWNALGVRLARPQVITHVPRAAAGAATASAATRDTGTDAATRLTMYFAGTSTKLGTGDALLFVVGRGDDEQVLRRVAAVNAQPDAKRTEVILAEPLITSQRLEKGNLTTLLDRYIDEAADILAGSDLAADAADALAGVQRLTKGAGNATVSASQLVSALQVAAAQVRVDEAIAVDRSFTRLAAWLNRLSDVLASTIDATAVLARTRSLASTKAVPTALGTLAAVLDQLAAPPSLQPATAARLSRTVAAAYGPQTDLAPRLLAALRPAAASTIYQALSATQTDPSQMTVSACRVRAGLFPGTYPGAVTAMTGAIPLTTPPTMQNSWGTLATATEVLAVPLDGVYDKIQAASWIAVRRPRLDTLGNATSKHTLTFHRVVSAQTLALTARATAPAGATEAASATATGSSNYVARTTILELQPAWLSDETAFAVAAGSADLLNQTVVYAQAEALAMADEPLDVDVAGHTLELDGIYDGLESGRWIIVSGQRTDVPGVAGVTASEAVMIAAVEQGARAPSCVAFPGDGPPFDQIDSVTPPNAAGDRLIVGRPSKSLPSLLAKLPTSVFSGQQFCDQVEMATGTFATAYVPTPAEASGDFPDFKGIFANPAAAPGSTDGPQWGVDVFAWRISTRPVHTVLTLANDLAYRYDSRTVTVYANVVRATQGQSVGEVLGGGDASQVFQTFALRQDPLTFVPASSPAGATTTLSVSVNGVDWSVEGSLAGAAARDRVFTTRTDDSGTASVIFGDGVHGARLPTGSGNVKAQYRYGMGSDGNVDARQISQLSTHPLGLQGVINPLPASGGADADSRDTARANTAIATMALDRLVSVSDYEAFARGYAGIGKACARRMSDGRRTIVEVTIAGAGDVPIDPSSSLYQNLVEALRAYGDPNQPVRVDVRSARLLVVAAAVQTAPGWPWETVEASVRAAVLAAFGFERRAIGQPAFLSELIGAMQGVDGVAYVNVTIFDSVAQDATASQLAALGRSLRLNQSVLARAAGLDASGKVAAAELVFMTPDIPDTLILTTATP
jgi:hypothetical protein